MRILRIYPFIGLVGLLFLSCGKNKISLSTTQDGERGAPGPSAPSTPGQESIEFLRLQAEEGIRDAQFKYGYLLATGRGMARDFKMARHWYAKAADQGHPEAQFRLGLLHLQGYGARENFAKHRIPNVEY